MRFPTLAELLADEDFRFRLKLKQADPAEFFRADPGGAGLLEERRALLRSVPGRHAIATADAGPLIAEAVGLARAWRSVPASGDPGGWDSTDPAARLRALGGAWEPDFMLLAPDAAGTLRLRAGCICFPSSWALAEKIGHTVAEIHGVVPGLNESLAGAIDGFLGRLKPGISYERSNWGLARVPALNMHPDLGLPRLAPPLALGDVWMRIEDQSFVALPGNHGVLFGIRLRLVPLAELKADAPAAAGLARALRTMSEPMLRYKGLWAARDEVVRLIED